MSTVSKKRLRYQEAADLYSRSVRTIKRWKANGWIVAAKGLVDVESIERFLKFVERFGRVPSDPAVLASAFAD